MTTPLPIADASRTRRAVGELLRPHRASAVGACLTLAVATTVGLAGIKLLGQVVDEVHTGGDDLARPAALLALVAVVQGVGTAVGAGRVAAVGERMVAQLRESFV